MQGDLLICSSLAGKTRLLIIFNYRSYFGTSFAKCRVTVSLVVNNRVMVQKRDIDFFDVPFLILF
jgi:hypothetical protein